METKKTFVGVLEYIEYDNEEITSRVEEVQMFSTLEEAKSFLSKIVSEMPSQVQSYSNAVAVYRWCAWSDEDGWEDRRYSIFECS